VTPKICATVLDDAIEDCDPEDDKSLYWYSTTVLPKFSGKGLGKMFRAYCLGLAMGRGYTKICGHTFDPAMRHILDGLGAEWGASHEDWYGSGMTAQYYEINAN
jgi:GNAT superfamily N-acetyltransferase